MSSFLNNLVLVALALCYSNQNVFAIRMCLQPLKGFELEYEVIGNVSIAFTMKSHTIVGWMAVGIHDPSENSTLQDIYIAGIYLKNGAFHDLYGSDYHRKDIRDPWSPVLDARRNWFWDKPSEYTNNVTILYVVRRLNTSDLVEDVVIQNRTLDLMFAYNANSHNASYEPTAEVHLKINFSDNSGIDCATLTTTTPTTTTTTDDNGSNIVSISSIMLIVTVWASFKF